MFFTSFFSRDEAFKEITRTFGLKVEEEEGKEEEEKAEEEEKEGEVEVEEAESKGERVV